MDGLRIFLLIFTGTLSCSRRVSGSVTVKRTVKPGDNVTIFCDCKAITGEFIVWYRNCSHVNQPTFVLKLKELEEPITDKNMFNLPPRFDFVRNESSQSYDLLITNIALSDEGLYFCGAEQLKVIKERKVSSKPFHRYCNMMTAIEFYSTEDRDSQECRMCWPLLFFLCPALTVLSSLLSSLLVYCMCRKTDKPKDDKKSLDPSDQASGNKSEDVCYAALEIHPPSHRPKKKRESGTDFSTYSSINTSRV